MISNIFQLVQALTYIVLSFFLILLIFLLFESWQYLVNYKSFSRTTKLLKRGIKYNELTEDEKIDIVAARILNRFRPAFEELAK